MTLKNGPEAIVSLSCVETLAPSTSVSETSSLCLARTSLMTRSSSSTWLRFGLSFTKPANCWETAETFSKR